VTPLKEDADILDFWVQHEQIYSDIANIAFDVLTIPASSAPVERVFLTVGHVSAGKRNRLSGVKLEREVLRRTRVSWIHRLCHAVVVWYTMENYAKFEFLYSH